jgi:2,5-diketo-D-gluconate reductase A
MTQQPSITLNDGVVMPQFGLGVWQTPNGEAAQAVRAAVAAGYRLVDTAAIYRNEDGVGEGLRGAEDVFLTTKLWTDSHGYDATLRAFDASLKRLGRDSIDLYLIHWPRPDLDLYVDSWRAMVRLREEGRTRSIGVSNFLPEHLNRIIDATGVVPAVNQIELHPDFQQREVRQVHADLGIAIESWSPLGQGRLLQHPVIGAVAAKHGKTPAQAIIRWHLDQGLIVIPKSVHAERIRQNIEVFDFRLDEADMAAIEGLDDADARIGSHPNQSKF